MENKHQQTPENSTQHDEINCKEQLKKVESTLSYLSADFDNYRKRVEKERSVWAAQAQNGVLKNIIPLIDDLERATKGMATEAPAAYQQGLKLILQEAMKFLQSYNIEEIATETFDPELHEAIMHQPSADHAPGTIVSVVEKGYKRGNEILRPAKVIVS
jgi:molecular chaperone GrpE